MTGFVLSVILTAIPFIIVMSGGLESRALTALIAIIDALIDAKLIPVPAFVDWASMRVQELVYHRVYLAGAFNHAAEVQSLAVTELGSGYWVMTPLLPDDGGTVFVNRGFVPQPMRDPTTWLASPPRGKLVVTGLLRASEPEGGFLRGNDPNGERWYSRDTAAIAQAKRLTGSVAPFFSTLTAAQFIDYCRCKRQR